MATVTSKTSVKIDELLGPTLIGAELDAQGALTFQRKNGGIIQAGSLGPSVVSATINGAKHLIFTTMQGLQIDAGSVDLSSPLDAWPVGSVFFGVTTANPATLLGGGTWVRFAKGKMLIGVDEADPSFDAVEETGGAKSKTLIASNLPPHPHTIAHTHPMPHDHPTLSSDDQTGLVSSIFQRAGNDGSVSNNNLVGATSTPNTGGSSAANSGNGPGTSTAVDVMNPYITTYMWKRIA